MLPLYALKRNVLRFILRYKYGYIITAKPSLTIVPRVFFKVELTLLKFSLR